MQVSSSFQQRLEESARSDFDDEDQDLEPSEVLQMLNNARVGNGTAWASSYHKLCQGTGLQMQVTDDGTRINSGTPGSTWSKQARPKTSSPGAPLELDFISGPRMGERLLLVDRTCTVGRGDNCTVKLNNAQLANISRVHCIFQCIGDRWWLSDNGSTNGTWQRLSCVLEPSKPVELSTGDTILAGTQELKVQEVEMPRWCIASTAAKVLPQVYLNPVQQTLAGS